MISLKRIKLLLWFMSYGIFLGTANNAAADIQETLNELKTQAKQAQNAATSSTTIAESKIKEAATLETQIAGQLKIIASQEALLGELKTKAATMSKEVSEALKQAALKTKEASELHEKIAVIRKNGSLKLADADKNLEVNEAEKELTLATTLAKKAQSISAEADRQTDEAKSDQLTADKIIAQAKAMKQESTQAQSDLERMEKDRKAIAALNNMPADDANQTDKDKSLDKARKINLLVNGAKNILGQITLAGIKSNEATAKANWVKLLSLLTDAQKENALYKDLHGSTQAELILEQANANHKEMQNTVAKLFDDIEKQISTTSGDSKSALTAIYEAWIEQWINHPFGATENDRHNLQEKAKEFAQKIKSNDQPHAPAQPDHNGDVVEPPPAY